MQTKELPSRPSLEQYKKQAKDLLKEQKSDAVEARRRIEQNHPRLGKLPDAEAQRADFRLTDAQLVIAREHGFESWPKFAKHIEALNRKNSPATNFEAAVDAVIAGNAAELQRLLRENPQLIRERSPRRHRATLLHYAAANGVEDYRQKTPANIVQITEILLKARAEVNAVGDMYGGSTALGLAATSVHPVLAGVQRELIDVLLAHGATIDKAVADNYTEGLLINACLANGRGDAAEHLANRGAALDLEGAAGVGRLDVVKTFFDQSGALKPDVPRKKMESGFMWACEYGKDDVAQFLLEMGLSPDATRHGATGLHWASYNAHLKIVELLLSRRASVNIIDSIHRGSPLGWALYGWANRPLDAGPANYYEVVARLVAAGAEVDREWLGDADRGNPLIKRIEADPRMAGALKG
jgi:ankyrin repeat protein